MRLLPVTAVGIAVLLLASACAAPGATPSGASSAPPAAHASASPEPAGHAPTMADLDARTFIVTGAEGYDPVAGSTISLRFEDGQLGIQAGCNSMGGRYQVDEAGVLTVGEMFTTEMACDPALMDQDNWLGDFVGGATLALDGDTLTLARDGVTLTATDKQVAMPDLPLEGTTWTVDGLVSADAVSSMPDGVLATLEFADGEVVVDAGCNRGSGPATIDGDTITFGPLVTTKMACEAPAGQVEGHVLAVLQGEVGYAIDADSLTLSGPGVGLTAKGS